MISTRFTQKLDIQHPIIQAGMGGVARAELVAAVSNAGGLGMLGMVRMTPDFIRDQIQKTRTLTKRPFGVNLIQPVAPASGIESQLEVCIEERVPVVSLFWSDPAPFVQSVPCRRYRRHAPGRERRRSPPCSRAPGWISSSPKASKRAVTFAAR